MRRFLHTFQSQICQFFTNFWNHFRADFYSTLIHLMAQVLHACPPLHSPRVKVLPCCYNLHIITNSHSMKLSSYLFWIQSGHHRHDSWAWEVKLHKLSKTSITVFVFHRLSGPWWWQIIIPKVSKTCWNFVLWYSHWGTQADRDHLLVLQVMLDLYSCLL